MVFRWLKAEALPFGSRPILDAAGHQCMSHAAVDEVVRSFWVTTVLRQHASEDPAARWNSFLSSEFGTHLPQASWPSVPWTEDRVRAALRGMRDDAAPGVTGVPLATWKALPPCWYAAVARLLTLVEQHPRGLRSGCKPMWPWCPRPQGESGPKTSVP